MDSITPSVGPESRWRKGKEERRSEIRERNVEEKGGGEDEAPRDQLHA